MLTSLTSPSYLGILSVDKGKKADHNMIFSVFRGGAPCREIERASLLHGLVADLGTHLSDCHGHAAIERKPVGGVRSL